MYKSISVIAQGARLAAASGRLCRSAGRATVLPMTSPRPPRWPLALAATLILPGCTLAPEDFSAQYALALCERSERCDLLAPFLVEQCRERAGGVLGDD